MSEQHRAALERAKNATHAPLQITPTLSERFKHPGIVWLRTCRHLRSNTGKKDVDVVLVLTRYNLYLCTVQTAKTVKMLRFDQLLRVQHSRRSVLFSGATYEIVLRVEDPEPDIHLRLTSSPLNEPKSFGDQDLDKFARCVKICTLAVTGKAVEVVVQGVDGPAEQTTEEATHGGPSDGERPSEMVRRAEDQRKLQQHRDVIMRQQEQLQQQELELKRLQQQQQEEKKAAEAAAAAAAAAAREALRSPSNPPEPADQPKTIVSETTPPPPSSLPSWVGWQGMPPPGMPPSPPAPTLWRPINSRPFDHGLPREVAPMGPMAPMVPMHPMDSHAVKSYWDNFVREWEQKGQTGFPGPAADRTY